MTRPKGGVGPRGRSGRRPRTVKPPRTKKREASESENPGDERPPSRTGLKFARRSVSGQRSDFNGYRIIDFDHFFTSISEHLRCECGGVVSVNESDTIGLFSVFNMTCGQCKKVVSIGSCKKVGLSSNAPEINRRFVYAMRCVGHGLRGGQVFCEVMDLPPPVQQTSFERINSHLLDAQKKIAILSMKTAAHQEKEVTESRDITVSGDGSWNTRGRTALNGVSTIIGAELGKVLDLEVRSKSCRGCDAWKGPTDTPEFVAWEEKHAETCTKIHSGSSGQMEAEGMKAMFLRSEVERDVRYMNYIGDGDSSTYNSILAVNPYSEPVTKIECVQHVQKRMGTRLRKRVAEGKTLSDKKKIGGKGRLTGKQIDDISGLYGKCIRDNPTSLTDMTNAIWALYYHKKSTDEEPDHHLCDIKWCKYLQAAKSGNPSLYKHHGVAPVCMEAIKDIFEDLTKPDLLTRCLGSRNQNANENFNSLIWKFCPKTVFAGLTTVQSAAYEAVIIFNEGHEGRLAVMRELNVTPGILCSSAARLSDEKRLSSANKKTSLATRESRTRRKKDAAEELQQQDKAGTSYGAGEF